MPPRPAKKGGAPSAAAAAAARAVRSTPMAAQAAPDATPVALVNQDDVDLEMKADEDDVVELEKKAEADETGKNGGLNVAEAGSNKDAFEDEDGEERLDLEDNEPEYEAEEEQVLDYDDREVDYEDEHQEGGEEEEIEGQVIEEEEELEEGDVVDEEDTGGDENAGEEEEEGHEDLVEHKEQHDVVKERRRRKEFEVFVGGLEKETTEEDLKKVFGRVGEVVDVRLMKNYPSNKSKGFAFLRFATVEQAKRAVVELKNPEINGKICGVAPSHDNDTLFIGNINVTWSKETLKQKLKLYGVDEYEDLTLVVDNNNKKMNRGFAFVDFASRSDAMNAFKRLRRRDVVFGVDRSAKVSFADSFNEPDDEIMAQVKTIFVDGIPASWDEDRVREYLKEYREIEKIELARNMPQAKRKDFGFVTFGTHDAAVACANAINNAELGEGSKKVKVRARLSRPHQKVRVKHHVQGSFENERGPSRFALGSSSRGPPPRFLPSRRVRRGDDALRSPPMSSHTRSNVAAPRDRRSYGGLSDNTRTLSPSLRAYDRGPTAVGAYHKRNSLKREYATREEFHVPRSSRFAAGYGPRTIVEKQPSYRDEYSSRGASYADVIPRGIMHSSLRKSHNSEGYDRLPERSHPSYRESRGRDYYDPVQGSKRPYAMLEEDPRYADPRQTRARIVYVDDYDDAYSERLGRDYGRSRNTLSARDSVYETRHGMSYAGPASHDDMDGMYSSRYGGQYMSREHGGGNSHSSVYTGRSSGGGGHMGSAGSRSYY